MREERYARVCSDKNPLRGGAHLCCWDRTVEATVSAEVLQVAAVTWDLPFETERGGDRNPW
jgi:hypothetical protein